MTRLLPVLPLLFLGLCINVAIAAVCDARANGWNPDPLKGTQRDVSPDAWCMLQVDTDGRVREYEFAETGYNARVFVSEKGVMEKLACEVETGWPLRSFKGRNSYTIDSSNGLLVINRTRSLFAHVRPAWWLSDSGDWKCRIILRPVWIGLFVNTIAYAGCVWVLFTTACRARDAIVKWSLSKGILLP